MQTGDYRPVLTCGKIKPMADRYRTPDDWTVEVVQLAEGERLRIRHRGYYIADVRGVRELEGWIPRAELDLLDRDTLILAFRLRRPTCRSPGRGGVCTRSTDNPGSGIGRSGALVPSGAEHVRARSRRATSRRWSDGLKLTVDRYEQPSRTIIPIIPVPPCQLPLGRV